MLVVGRQYALIKKCALSSQVRLITRVYGTCDWALHIEVVYECCVVHSYGHGVARTQDF